VSDGSSILITVSASGLRDPKILGLRHEATMTMWCCDRNEVQKKNAAYRLLVAGDWRKLRDLPRMVRISVGHLITGLCA
jgi:hypothetical protein